MKITNNTAIPRPAYCTVISPVTAKGKALLQTARNNEGDSLYCVYTRFSPAKARTFQKCRELCYKEKGHNFRIISHNTFRYSVAWQTAYGTRIETAENSYFIPGF